MAARVWAKGAVWGLAAICGVRVEFRGVENIPRGRALVASKHLSMLDTILPFAVFRDPAIVLKTELLSFPVFGWYCQRAGMIVVDRSAHASALRGMSVPFMAKPFDLDALLSMLGGKMN